MARMHARRRGRSGSHTLTRAQHPEWAPSPDEVATQVVKLARKGLSSAGIGTHLRDCHGVPSVKLATGKSVTALMRENGEAPNLPEDMTNLMRKAVKLNEHLLANHRDIHNRRALQLTEAKIMRLARYYRRSGALPTDWRYSLNTAKLLVG